jgi:hypothetical protein
MSHRFVLSRYYENNNNYVLSNGNVSGLKNRNKLESKLG